MYLIKIGITKCKEGDILAENIYSRNGVNLIVAKGSVLNRYILDRLADMGINKVCIYDSREDEKPSAQSEYQMKHRRLTSLTKSLFHDIVAGKPVEYTKLTAITEMLFHCIHDENWIINCIDLIRSKDEYTYQHSINVAFYAMLLAKWLKHSEGEIRKAALSGLLHDIGKTRIPDKLLNKKDTLTTAEFELVKKHAMYGYEIVKNIGTIDQDMKEAVLLHHERMDGSGYPYGYTSDDITPFARIVAIADVFDAMTSDRIYKDRATPFDVFKMFSTEGVRMFDLSMINVFMMKMSNYLIGSKVQLSNGNNGEIVYVPYHSLPSPVVRVTEEYIDLSSEKYLTIVKMI